MKTKISSITDKTPKQILSDTTDWRKLYIQSEAEKELWKAKAIAQEKYLKNLRRCLTF